MFCANSLAVDYFSISLRRLFVGMKIADLIAARRRELRSKIIQGAAVIDVATNLSCRILKNISLISLHKNPIKTSASFLIAMLLTWAICKPSFKIPWHENLGSSDKSIFWTTFIGDVANCVMALSTIFVMIIANQQYMAFKRDSKTKATISTIDEWYQKDIQSYLSFPELYLMSIWDYEPWGSRLFARRVFKGLIYKARRSSGLKCRKEYRTKLQEINNVIESINTLAVKTWNLIGKKIIDADLFFSHLDYCIVSSYFEYEDVLAIRQSEYSFLYNEFTDLARLAQSYYAKRGSDSIVSQLIDQSFDDLPCDEKSFKIFHAKVARKDLRFKCYDLIYCIFSFEIFCFLRKYRALNTLCSGVFWKYCDNLMVEHFSES